MKIYRIFLPKFYDDGKKIPMKKILKIAEQIRIRFGGYSLRPASLPVIQGVWASKEKKIYAEEMFMIEIFMEDTFNNKKWLKSSKELWRQELKQEEIFVIVQDAEILSDNL